jgi:glycosyltransferase involved in cell wall biosynthesis
MNRFVSSAFTIDANVDVSVIIPTFNRLNILPRAVESCRGTRCHTQIIVVDDGSTDGTWEWLQNQQDILALRQSNQGQTWATNLGQRHAVGTYLRFLDSDDYLSPGMIDRQFEAAVAAGADIVYSRVDRYEEETKLFEVNPEPPMWDDFIAVMLGETYGSHFLGMLFRTAFVSDIPRRPEFALREDRMFLLEAALRHPSIVPVGGCAGYWVKHKQQMHTSYRGLQATAAAWQMWKLYERTLSRLEAAGELTPRRARAATHVLWTTAHEIARSHLPEAEMIVRRVYQLHPSFVPPDGRLLRRLYKLCGYAATQRLLRLRRAVIRRR